MPNLCFGVSAGQDLTLFMGSEDTLHLTYDEARELASWVRRELTCDFESEETITVADVLLDHGDARELLLMIELGIGPDHKLANDAFSRDDRALLRDRDDFVNWRKEGF